MLTLEEKLQTLPKAPGVYLFKDSQGKIIYIGKARVLRNRVKQYFQNATDGRYQFEHLVSRIADVEVITTDSELEALILENNLVRDKKPRYNIDLRDDKSFPFLRITNEPFPRVFLTRHPVKDGSRYFGPFSDLFHLRGLLRVLRSALRIRTCNLALSEESIALGKFKSCLEYHIGRCNAPCIGVESREEYARRIRDFTDVATGHGGDVIRSLQNEMQRLSDDLKFEQAAQLRDWLAALENLTQKQKVISADPLNRDIIGLAVEDDAGVMVVFQVRAGRMLGRFHYRLTKLRDETAEDILESALERYYTNPVSLPEDVMLPFALPQDDWLTDLLRDRAGRKVSILVPARGEKAHLIELARRNAELLLQEQQLARQSRDRIPVALHALQEQFKLAAPPDVIAAFDISTLQGTDKVASMVVFHNGRAARSQYRKFKIRTVEQQDDFACMREAVLRRFTRLVRENQPRPDLVLIDGGKGQLAAALEALAEAGVPDQPVFGLAKRLEEIYLPGDPEPHYLPRTSSALKLLQQIRDEAHHFAITYHRQLRGKRIVRSSLDEIPGVGPSRRKALMRHFGSINKLREATLDEIRQVDGVPESVAGAVYSFYHDQSQSDNAPENGI
jgi:excinuclease ABC subunit C